MYDAILRNTSLCIVKHSHCKRPHLPVFIEVSEGKESWDWNFSIRKIWHLKLSEDNRCHVYIYCWWLKIQFTIFLLFLWVIDGRKEVDWSLLLRRHLLPALGFGGSWLGLRVKTQFIGMFYHVRFFPGEKNPLLCIPTLHLWLGTSLNYEIPLCVKSNDLIPIYKCEYWYKCRHVNTHLLFAFL